MHVRVKLFSQCIDDNDDKQIDSELGCGMWGNGLMAGGLNVAENDYYLQLV